MKSNSQKSKIELLKHWTRKNFTNRAMFMLSGIEDILNNKKYKDLAHYIDMTYDLVSPELSMEHNQTKPSRTLAAVAFNDALRQEDYEKLVAISHEANPQELKEFLSQEIDHQPVEKVIDYMSFPLLAMMISHLKPWEKVDVLLMKPELIHKTFEGIRSKTLKELMTENDVELLRRKAPKELSKDLEIGPIPTSWSVHMSGITKEGIVGATLDQRFVQAQGHWADVRDTRKVTTQTGISRKIALWKQKHNIKD